jgi:hypothetical protein
MVTDVVDLIDEAIHDWTVSVDAMRWTPPEPNWDQPPIPLRAEGFRYLTDVQGMDGYAAAAYGAMQLRLFGRALSETFDAMNAGLAAAFEGLRRSAVAWMDAVIPELKRAVKDAEQIQSRTVLRDRPAWQSKYGPAHRRRGGRA